MQDADLVRKTDLSGGVDGRERTGLACNLDDRSEVRLEQRAFGAGVSSAGGARRACNPGPDIVPQQDPLEQRVTPERNLDQRMDALRAANEVRALRAQLKRDLKAGRVSIGSLLLDPPPYPRGAGLGASRSARRNGRPAPGVSGRARTCHRR